MSTTDAPPAATDEALPGEAGRRPGRGLRMVSAVIAALVVAVTMAQTAWTGLNGDVAYALGGIETAGKGGVSIWDIFVARPVAYKLVLGWLDQLRGVLVGAASLRVQATVLRAETAVLVAAVAAVLLFGVRRYLGGRAAAGAAVAVGLALIVAPPWHFLEPDWFAVLAGVLAVGAACAPRRLWLGALLGGLGALLVVAVKLATAPVALLALLLVGVFSLRRAVWTTASTGVLVALWYALTRQLLPWEWIWLRDQANLVDDSPIHHGLRWADFHHLLTGLADVAVISPVVVVAPAAAVLLIRRRPPGRPRWIALAVAVIAAGLSVASAYGQGEFYMYHYAPVPVLAAGVCGVAFVLCRGARVPLALGTLAVAGASFALLRQSPEWRVGHVFVVAAAYSAASVVAAVAAVAGAARIRGSAPWVIGVVALCVALTPAVATGAPYSFSTYNHSIHSTHGGGDEYVELSERIGRDTPVLYLTFGAVNHAMGNPTSCRYPSPQWLQRGSRIPEVRTYRSYADNLRCLTDDRAAEYLIWQTRWYNRGNVTPQVKALLDARFDCSPAARIPAPENFVVCPARR
jgi:hypothetical protein